MKIDGLNFLYSGSVHILHFFSVSFLFWKTSRERLQISLHQLNTNFNHTSFKLRTQCHLIYERPLNIKELTIDVITFYLFLDTTR